MGVTTEESRKLRRWSFSKKDPVQPANFPEPAQNVINEYHDPERLMEILKPLMGRNVHLCFLCKRADTCTEYADFKAGRAPAPGKGREFELFSEDPQEITGRIVSQMTGQPET